jgi:hypothetical protein
LNFAKIGATALAAMKQRRRISTASAERIIYHIYIDPLRVRLKITSRFSGLETNGSIFSWFPRLFTRRQEALAERTAFTGGINVFS